MTDASGLVLALTAAGRAKEASAELDNIWTGDRDRIEYIIADAEIDMARNAPGRAADKSCPAATSHRRLP